MLSWAISYWLYYLLFYVRWDSRGPNSQDTGGEGEFSWVSPGELLSVSLLLQDSILSWRHTFCAVKPLLGNAFLRLKDKFVFYSGNVSLCDYNFCFQSTLQHTIVQPVVHLLNPLYFTGFPQILCIFAVVFHDHNILHLQYLKRSTRMGYQQILEVL